MVINKHCFEGYMYLHVIYLMFFIQQTGRRVSLSEQAFVDCSWGQGNNGCDGGESERAFEWMLKNGCLPTEASYGQYMMQVYRDNT